MCALWLDGKLGFLIDEGPMESYNQLLAGKNASSSIEGRRRRSYSKCPPAPL